MRESEEFCSTLLKESPHPIVVIDPDCTIGYVNPAVEKVTGFTSAELIGKKPPYPWWPEDLVDKIGQDFKRAFREGAHGLEEQFQRKNGERFCVEITSTLITRNGESRHYLSNWVNITERKWMEEILREDEERYHSILDQTTDCIFTVDVETKRILEANPAFCRLLGYDPDEMSNMTLYDFIAHDRETIDRDIRKIVETG